MEVEEENMAIFPPATSLVSRIRVAKNYNLLDHCVIIMVKFQNEFSQQNKGGALKHLHLHHQHTANIVSAGVRHGCYSCIHSVEAWMILLT
jgi:hypothetical protein